MRVSAPDVVILKKSNFPVSGREITRISGLYPFQKVEEFPFGLQLPKLSQEVFPHAGGLSHGSAADLKCGSNEVDSRLSTGTSFLSWLQQSKKEMQFLKLRCVWE